MSSFSPVWRLKINSVEYTNLILSDLTITSGRIDIYTQPIAGYVNLTVINLDQSDLPFNVSQSVSIELQDSTGTFVPIFGGTISDLELSIAQIGNVGYSQSYRITALGALAKLPKTLFNLALSQDFDGEQIYKILSETLFNQWQNVPAGLTWGTYDPTVTWANAENNGLGEIDRPGDYLMIARGANPADSYSVASQIALSGLGYLYEDAEGRIGYADSTHRSSYLATNGYVELSGNHALTSGIRTIRRLGDLRNKVTIEYKANATVTAEDAESIALYGQQAQLIQTSIEKNADATSQANFYLAIRAFPQDIFQSITFPLGNPEIDDADRDALLNVFMGLPVDIQDLPSNMVNGRFQGFVEGWSFRASYNNLSLTLNVSPTAFSLQSMKWDDVGALETWNTINASLDWNNATIVA
jgi:hypothetical protein